MPRNGVFLKIPVERTVSLFLSRLSSFYLVFRRRKLFRKQFIPVFPGEANQKKCNQYPRKKENPTRNSLRAVVGNSEFAFTLKEN